jgi:hypothetical protein
MPWYDRSYSLYTLEAQTKQKWLENRRYKNRRHQCKKLKLEMAPSPGHPPTHSGELSRWNVTSSPRIEPAIQSPYCGAKADSRQLAPTQRGTCQTLTFRSLPASNTSNIGGIELCKYSSLQQNQRSIDELDASSESVLYTNDSSQRSHLSQIEPSLRPERPSSPDFQYLDEDSFADEWSALRVR